MAPRIKPTASKPSDSHQTNHFLHPYPPGNLAKSLDSRTRRSDQCLPKTRQESEVRIENESQSEPDEFLEESEL